MSFGITSSGDNGGISIHRSARHLCPLAIVILVSHSCRSLLPVASFLLTHQYLIVVSIDKIFVANNGIVIVAVAGLSILPPHHHQRQLCQARLVIPAGILRIPVFSVPVALFSQESRFLFRRNFFGTPPGNLSVWGLRRMLRRMLRRK